MLRDWIAGIRFWISSPHPKPCCQCCCAHWCSFSVYLRLSLQLLSNNFHVRLILKGQKLWGSQQWADGGWLNMHLIPFGLVSVSKPPTFLSDDHSYGFSNQFRPWLGLRWLLIDSRQKMCGLWRLLHGHTGLSWWMKEWPQTFEYNP